ncbi:hypothetical protein RRG08_047875 [Elysia crispata]|uniref:Uncharacterized protein n=1 Tax=Elysia crispata TaxID=231223 RepID=A0AAE0ZLT4_9GAST|nr:hypothetical protein RRG08_047875 [Elysia crispata]
MRKGFLSALEQREKQDTLFYLLFVIHIPRQVVSTGDQEEIQSYRNADWMRLSPASVSERKLGKGEREYFSFGIKEKAPGTEDRLGSNQTIAEPQGEKCQEPFIRQLDQSIHNQRLKRLMTPSAISADTGSVPRMSSVECASLTEPIVSTSRGGCWSEAAHPPLHAILAQAIEFTCMVRGLVPNL